MVKLPCYAHREARAHGPSSLGVDPQDVLQSVLADLPPEVEACAVVDPPGPKVRNP